MKIKDIKEAKTSELVEFYNSELVNLPVDSKISKRPVNKFADRKTAEKRVAALIEELAAAEESAEVPETEEPQNEKAKPTGKRVANNSAGIAKSWTVPEVARKRSERSAVEVDGQYFKSVRAAYIELGLDLKDHIQFRMLLKEKGKTKVDGRTWNIVPINYSK